MRVCSSCQEKYEAEIDACPRDGAPLEVSAEAPGRPGSVSESETSKGAFGVTALIVLFLALFIFLIRRDDTDPRIPVPRSSVGVSPAAIRVSSSEPAAIRVSSSEPATGAEPTRRVGQVEAEPIPNVEERSVSRAPASRPAPAPAVRPSKRRTDVRREAGTRKWYRVVRRVAVVRSAPSGGSKVVRRIPRGVAVDVVGAQGGFLEVRSHSGRPPGWVKAGDLEPVELAEATTGRRLQRR
jgi:hypothetical protein